MLTADSAVNRKSFVPAEHIQGRRGACSQKRSNYNAHLESSEILTTDQKSAFREVFDLFDSNGGGSIDAEELNEALGFADIHLTKEEISEVLSSMDKDGNGEIDFEEFLQLMTNTERFLESVMCKDAAGAGQREVLLFEALTQFMKKSALHSINEIVGYYHNKYKKVQAPHVIRHYAAGARLIGLSEQQIRRHLDQLRKSSSNNKSPYAHPPYAFTSQIQRNSKKGTAVLRQKLEQIAEDTQAPANILGGGMISEKIDLLVPKLGVPRCGRGKIRLSIVWDAKKHEKTTSWHCPTKPGNHTTAHTPHVTKFYKKNNGSWTAQRFSPSTVREHLPALTNDLTSKQFKENKNIVLDFDDMKNIRKRVKDIAKVYYSRIQSQKCDRASDHLRCLGIEDMSVPMRKTFCRAFDAYTNYKNTPVSSLCSQSLA